MLGLGHRRERVASRWLARMKNEGTAFDREAFERWRAAAPANARAFDEVARSWGLDLPVADTRFARERSGDAAGVPPSRRIRHTGLATLAAVLLAAIFTVALIRTSLSSSSKLSGGEQLAARDSTDAHEVRAYRLSDGSVVTLRAGSQFAQAYTGKIRSLTLLRGSARFDVAHDAQRPFQVHAGQSLITARGTVFDVRLVQKEVQVVLLRGAIDVERLAGARRTGDVRKLVPGQRVTVPVTGPLGGVQPITAPVAAERMLSFDETPLAVAVRSMNSRNRRRIVLDEAGVRGEPITGGFNAHDPDGFALTIAAMFDLAVARRANGDLLLSPKH